MANGYYNAPATKQKNPVLALKNMASSPAVQKRFADVLGDKAPAFLAGVIGAVNTNKDLTAADPNSVLASAMVAATLNLSCVPSLGQAALVPYKNNGVMYAQFQVMTRGLIQLAQRTGQYRNINAGEVYEDEFQGDDLLTGEVYFQRVKGGYRDQGQRNKIVGYFAYIETVTGFKKTEYWTKADIEVHRDRFSKARFNGPWKDNFDAMAKKTVLKSLLNHYGPMSVDSQLATAIEDDQKVYNADGEGEYLDNPMRDIDADVLDAEPRAETPQQSIADSALESSTTASSAASQTQPQPQPQAMGYDSSTADAPLNGPENFQGDDFDDLVF